MSTWPERLRLEARPAPSRMMQWVSPLIAAVLTVVAGFAMFLALGKDPLVAFHAFFVAPLSSVIPESVTSSVALPDASATSNGMSPA